MSAYSVCLFLFLNLNIHEDPTLTMEVATQQCAGLDGDDRPVDFDVMSEVYRNRLPQTPVETDLGCESY